MRGSCLAHTRVHGYEPDDQYGLNMDTAYLSCTNGTSQDYSSTNFELLGLLLMKAANVSAWDQLDQRSAVFTTE